MGMFGPMITQAEKFLYKCDENCGYTTTSNGTAPPPSSCNGTKKNGKGRCGASISIEYTASQLEAKKAYHADMDAAETWPEKKAILVKVQQAAMDAAKRNGQMGRRLLDLRSPALKQFSQASMARRSNLSCRH